MSSAIRSAVERYAWILVFLFPLMLPGKQYFKLPLAAMALVGLVWVVRNGRRLLVDEHLRLLMVLFVLVWVPMVAAVGDAANLSHALRKTGTYPMFFFAGAFIVAFARSEGAQVRLVVGLLILMTAWYLDAFWQFYSGTDVFGLAQVGSRFGGMFVAAGRFSIVLAIFAPVYMYALALLARRHWAVWLLLVPYLLAVILGGTRSSWVMLCLGLLLYSGLRWPSHVRRLSSGRRLAVVGTLAVALVAGASQIPAFQTRFDSLSGLWSGDMVVADRATGGRFTIWDVGLRASLDHWANGVGPRGFRYVYRSYAREGDYLLASDPPHLPTHPHQFFLEIMVETGLIGVLGFAVFAYLWVRFLMALSRGPPSGALAWASSATIAFFPLNFHKSFYGSFSAGIGWWLIALSIAACARISADAGGADGEQRPDA